MTSSSDGSTVVNDKRATLVEYIMSEMSRHDHQCDSWAIAMEIPNTVLFRQYGLWWHLRSLLP
jgi:hypothetical protein